MSQSHSSALLIRVWLDDVGDTFRARLLSIDGPGTKSAVGDWLERFLAAAGG